MLWNLRLRFARWLLEPLEAERAQRVAEAMRALVAAQEQMVVQLEAFTDERPTIQ